MIKALIFDIGDVLHHVNLQGFADWFAEKHNVDKEEFLKIEVKNRVAMDAGEIDEYQHVKNIEDHFLIKINPKEYYDTFFLKYTRSNKELLEYIKKHKQKYKMFVLSNNNPPFHEHMKKEADYHNIFDKIFLSYKKKMKKPDPEFYLKLLKGTGIKPEECVFTDDREDNVKESEKLGMKGVRYISFEDFLDKIHQILK